MKKIYLSGKITGDSKAWEKFQEAESFYLSKGFDVVNPCKIFNTSKESFYDHRYPKTWEEYMKIDLMYMFKCDEVVMLENWRDSKGASLEKYVAEKLNMKVSLHICNLILLVT